MYEIVRNTRGKKPSQISGLFTTYERARQALRKYIRKGVKSGKLTGAFGYGGMSTLWDNISRNPTRYTDAGFTIRQVA